MDKIKPMKCRFEQSHYGRIWTMKGPKLFDHTDWKQKLLLLHFIIASVKTRGNWYFIHSLSEPFSNDGSSQIFIMNDTRQTTHIHLTLRTSRLCRAFGGKAATTICKFFSVSRQGVKPSFPATNRMLWYASQGMLWNGMEWKMVWNGRILVWNMEDAQNGMEDRLPFFHTNYIYSI